MKKKILLTIGILFGVLLLSMAAYGFYLYKSVTDTAAEIHVSLEREQSSMHEVKVDVKQQKKHFLSLL
jgi:anionic cell wall polymer biosynthesis LytR-Cps2A-Psr (LCP) family protein